MSRRKHGRRLITLFLLLGPGLLLFSQADLLLHEAVEHDPADSPEHRSCVVCVILTHAPADLTGSPVCVEPVRLCTLAPHQVDRLPLPLLARSPQGRSPPIPRLV